MPKFSFHEYIDGVMIELIEGAPPKAVVLMISDFIMDKIDVNTEKLVLKCKENNTKFHSLVIASVANPKALEIFDKNWIYRSGNYEALKPVIRNFKVI